MAIPHLNVSLTSGDKVSPVEECGRAAYDAGNMVFALDDSGQCLSSLSAHVNSSYKQYGGSYTCDPDGQGGIRAMNVYKLKGKFASGKVSGKLVTKRR